MEGWCVVPLILESLYRHSLIVKELSKQQSQSHCHPCSTTVVKGNTKFKSHGHEAQLDCRIPQWYPVTIWDTVYTYLLYHGAWLQQGISRVEESVSKAHYHSIMFCCMPPTTGNNTEGTCFWK